MRGLVIRLRMKTSAISLPLRRSARTGAVSGVAGVGTVVGSREARPAKLGSADLFASRRTGTRESVADRLEGVALRAQLHDFGVKTSRLARASAGWLGRDEPHLRRYRSVAVQQAAGRRSLPCRQCSVPVRKCRSLVTGGSVRLRPLFVCCRGFDGLRSLGESSAPIGSVGVLNLDRNSSALRPRIEPILNAEVSAEIGAVAPLSDTLTRVVNSSQEPRV